MSFDIHVLVPARSWPTARQLDHALACAAYPVRLGARSDAAWDEPLAPVSEEPMPFVVRDENQAFMFGRPIGTQLEMPRSTVMPVFLDGALLEPDFGIEMLTDPSDLNAKLRLFDYGPTAQPGDRLVCFSHHVDERAWNAAIYVLAALILQFDGHGFEWQGIEHGRARFAAELLDSLYPDPVENPFARA